MEKVWTTDGIYRETRDKAARRKAVGLLPVWRWNVMANSGSGSVQERSISGLFNSSDNHRKYDGY